MARHREAGGLVVAATHQALGLEEARELRIERPEPDAPRGPRPGDPAIASGPGLEDWA
jgi:heme exporter protein A